MTFEYRAHGGARAGAGRKPKGARPGVVHRKRGELGGSAPVLVTMKIRAGVANLRARARCRVILRALQKARDRFGTRLVEFSVQHDHVHIIAEAKDAEALARAMQGLAVRLARQLNRSLERRGTVFADRYHHRALTTPRQVRNALAYVLCNARKHRVAHTAPGGSTRSRLRRASTDGHTVRRTTSA
jgi:REP element-mobilizing transposase RayT